jgi:cytochrome b subunit of formate dehydrogenase
MVDHAASPAAGGKSVRRTRHLLVDRMFHWLSAASVLVLMATALLPIVGFDFAWVTVHWITGLVLAGLVFAHVVRAIGWQDLASMWIGPRDLRKGVSSLKQVLAGDAPRVEGKYSLAQRAIHLAFALVVLTAIATGCLMLVKIDTPWWRRDPYWLGDTAWGVIYVLHDLATLCLVTMVIVHIYFALRPEKLYLTRSMLLGWITGAEYEKHYDPSRWRDGRDRTRGA